MCWKKIKAWFKPRPEPVSFMVCSQSGGRPNSWCPDVVTKTSPPDTQPNFVCGGHVEPWPEKPYFGTSCYQAIVFDIEDIKNFLQKLKVAGGS